MCSEICQFPSFLRTMSNTDEREEDHEREKAPETSSSDQPEDITKLETDKTDREPDKPVPEDDDDGFKTPDHKIPAITECPPAPKKPPPPPPRLKRKATSPPPGACRSLQFEASTAEVESIFRPILDGQDDAMDRKIKRARKDVDDDDDDDDDKDASS